MAAAPKRKPAAPLAPPASNYCLIPNDPIRTRPRYGRLSATHWPGTSRPPMGTTTYCLPSCR